jgi:hypothetical protein
MNKDNSNKRGETIMAYTEIIYEIEGKEGSTSILEKRLPVFKGR